MFLFLFSLPFFFSRPIFSRDWSCVGVSRRYGRRRTHVRPAPPRPAISGVRSVFRRSHFPPSPGPPPLFPRASGDGGGGGRGVRSFVRARDTSPRSGNHESTPPPPSTSAGFSRSLLIWSPRFRRRASSRCAARWRRRRRELTHQAGGGESVSQGCKDERRTERGKSRARRRDEIRGVDGERERRDRLEEVVGEDRRGGLKGSERLDKSNPLKVRPTLCLPMRARIPARGYTSRPIRSGEKRVPTREPAKGKVARGTRENRRRRREGTRCRSRNSRAKSTFVQYSLRTKTEELHHGYFAR